MNTRLNLTAGLILIMILSSCGGKEEKQSVNPAGTENPVNIKPVADEITFSEPQSADYWKHYLAIKNALVAGNSNAAQSAADEMSAALSENYAGLRPVADEMANTDDLGEQRQFFAELTAKSENLLTGHLIQGKVYKQYCPMAFNNQGGYWYSDKEQIRNPYFGDQMLKCGKVSEVINPQGK